MAIQLEQFTSQLADSGLLSGEDVQVLLAGVRADEQPQDGEQLARLLVREKRLTAFQAQQIYQGKGKNLALGNYLVLDKLGQGGMGMVLKAEHRRMKRLVAIKILSPSVTRTTKALQRFQREVEAAAKLEHPNIVTAYDADVAGSTHFLVMQFIEGTDLSALVKKQGRLPVAKALSCILQAAQGLEYAHAKGIIHRDIKPANLLLDSTGTLKILDMGLARLDSFGAMQDELTGSGQIMGTVDYMAPEQAVNTKRADQRADIYSLGATLWFLLTGKHMYAGETSVEKIMAHQTQPIPSLRAKCPTVPVALEEVFQRMVAKAPEERYQTMAACLADLQRCQGDAAASAPLFAPGMGVNTPRDQVFRDISLPATTSAKGEPALGVAVAVALSPEQSTLPYGSLEATLDAGASQAGTIANLESFLPSPLTGALGGLPYRKPRSRRAWWRKRATLIAASAGLLPLLLFGLWAILRSGDKNKIVQVDVPPGKITPADVPSSKIGPADVPSDKVAPVDVPPDQITPVDVPDGGSPTVEANPGKPAAPADPPSPVVTNSLAIRPGDGLVEVLPIIDLVADVPPQGGVWTRKGRTLRGPQQNFARITLPVVPRGDYEATFDFTRIAGEGPVDLFLPVLSRHVQFVFDGWKAKGLNGLQSVDGREEPDPQKHEGVSGFRLQDGRRYTVKIAVKANAADLTIDVQLDGKPFVTWSGPAASLGLINERFNLSAPGVLGVGAWNTVVEFHSVKLRMLNGEAFLLRPADVAKLQLNAN